MITLKTKINLPIDKLKLDLGCGKSRKNGFIGIDIQDNGQEIVWDITKGIPLPDNSVSEIFSSHFIEHIDIADIDNLIYEIIRVCVNDGIVEIRCPHSDSNEAYFACHNSLWDERRFRAICQGLAPDNFRVEPVSFEIVGIEIIARLIVKK